MFARIRCKVSRERIQHSPTCPRLAFSHNSISTLVKQRGWFHTACLNPATVPVTKTQVSVWLHTSHKGYKIQVKSYRSQWRGHQEGLVKCVKNKKWSRQQENTGDAPTHGRQTNPFNTSPYKQKAKKKKDISLYSCQVLALLHSFTHSSFPPPSISLPYIMAFCQWIYTFFFLLPLQPPAFLFSRWWQIIFCNGLRCWQPKVTWFMSRQQLDYDGISPPPHITLTPLLTLFTSSLRLTQFLIVRVTFSLFYSFIHSLSSVQKVMAQVSLPVHKQITLTGANCLSKSANKPVNDGNFITIVLGFSCYAQLYKISSFWIFLIASKNTNNF